MTRKPAIEHPKGLMIGENRAFVDRIAWYSVGIVNVLAQIHHEERRMGDVLGSGTVCTWKGHSLVLTANHVVEKTPLDRLAFLLRVGDAINWEGNGQPEKVIQRVSLPVDRIVRCKEHDLAAIVLRPEKLARYRMQFCHLPGQLMRRRTLRRKGAVMLLGFPVDRVFAVSEVKTANAINSYFAAKPTILTATLADPPSKRLLERAVMLTTPVWPANEEFVNFRVLNSGLGESSVGSMKIGVRTPVNKRWEFTYGNYKFIRVQDGSDLATYRSESTEPAALTSVRKLLPAFHGSFEPADLIRLIADASAEGQPARCIDFDTPQRRPAAVWPDLRGCA